MLCHILKIRNVRNITIYSNINNFLFRIILMPVSKEVQKYNLRIRIEYFKSASIVDFYFPRRNREKSNS